MPLQPLGHEELTRRKRQKAIAAFYNANPTKLQQGVPPSQMDGMTYLDRRLGNTTERSISAGGLVVEDPGCGCDAGGGGGSNITITVGCVQDLITFSGGPAYPAGTYTFTVTGSFASCLITLTTGSPYKIPFTSGTPFTTGPVTIDTSFTLSGSILGECGVIPVAEQNLVLTCGGINLALANVTYEVYNNTPSSIMRYVDSLQNDFYILPGTHFNLSSSGGTYSVTCPASLA